MLSVVEKPSGRESRNGGPRSTQLLQQGALTMLQHALEAEVEDYVRRHRGARDERGHAQVVRNGKAPARQLVTGSGTLDGPGAPRRRSARG